jgi:ornithine cyclodeaminase/alanine dehydrogenase-like protein (mu-crystallin family)
LSAVPVFAAADVERAISPGAALDVVREAFVAHRRGEWTMPSKLYVTNYPAGDFRAMPALGGGHALLKWVTSFPGNPGQGLPTVSGVVLLSNAGTGQLEAVLDAGAVTALRTGAAAVLAAETLGRTDAQSVTVVGAGVNGRAAARTFLARGRSVAIWDVDGDRAAAAARELGCEVAGSRGDALAADVLVTVTPGREVVLPEGSLRPGQHVSLMGADGPDKAEIASEELGRARLFCDEWEQASHSGDLAHAFEAGVIDRSDVTELGAVLVGEPGGRQHAEDITVFDSTGLAIQDLGIAIAVFERARDLDLPTLTL